jgi:hypothetical protein
MSAISAEVFVETKQASSASTIEAQTAPNKRQVAFVRPDLERWNPADEGNVIVKAPRSSANGYRVASIEMLNGRFLILFERSIKNPGVLPFGIGRGKFKNVNTSIELTDSEALFCDSLQTYLRSHMFQNQKHHFGDPARYTEDVINDFFVEFYKPRMQNPKKMEQTYGPKLVLKVPLEDGDIKRGKVVMGDARTPVKFADLLDSTGEKARRLSFTKILVDVGYFWYGRGQHGATVVIEKINLLDDIAGRAAVDFDNLGEEVNNEPVGVKRGTESRGVKRLAPGDADTDSNDPKRLRPSVI